MCKILFEAGAKRIYPSIKNFGVINDEKSISKIPKVLSRNKVSLMTIHLFSSCPMGENKNICSVDSYGRLFGYDNIYVNDGVFCQMLQELIREALLWQLLEETFLISSKI